MESLHAWVSDYVKGDTVNYKTEVEMSGSKWTLLIRYSVFRAFYFDLLAQHSNFVFDFPPKGFFVNPSPEERQETLSAFLQHTVKFIQSLPEVPEATELLLDDLLKISSHANQDVKPVVEAPERENLLAKEANTAYTVDVPVKEEDSGDAANQKHDKVDQKPVDEEHDMAYPEKNTEVETTKHELSPEVEPVVAASTATEEQQKAVPLPAKQEVPTAQKDKKELKSVLADTPSRPPKSSGLSEAQRLARNRRRKAKRKKKSSFKYGGEKANAPASTKSSATVDSDEDQRESALQA